MSHLFPLFSDKDGLDTVIEIGTRKGKCWFDNRQEQVKQLYIPRATVYGKKLHLYLTTILQRYILRITVLQSLLFR